MDRTSPRADRPCIDVLGPLLADFQLVGDGVDRLVAAVTSRPGVAPSAA